MRLLVLLLLGGCVATADSRPETDSGTGTVDSGAVDTGTSPDPDAGVVPGVDAEVGFDAGPGDPPPPVGTDPRDSATVYWVGHSLSSARDALHPSSRTLFELVGDFASAAGQSYDFHRHTTPGAPLSWNWNEESAKRAEIETRGGRYDVMIMTEGISLAESIRWHNTAFYAQRFYCAMNNANPASEVYLYESWHHLYGSDPEQRYPEPHVFDWRARLDEDRPRWESIIDDAMRADLPPPSDMPYYDGGRCTPSRQMRLIPAGTAIAALVDALETNAPVWEGLTRHGLVQNGYRNWPSEWPVAPGTPVDWRARMSTLETIHPGVLDDIHPNRTLIYFVALVHYSTVYRRSPIGLPALNGVSPSLARAMQELVWNVVTRDPRTGVTG
ncbi:MAG: hypothetical protein AAGE52_25775 [Myxococcota bacterium]